MLIEKIFKKELTLTNQYKTYSEEKFSRQTKNFENRNREEMFYAS
jgi:hypothetical protein